MNLTAMSCSRCLPLALVPGLWMLMQAGCSFAFVSGPPKARRIPYEDRPNAQSGNPPTTGLATSRPCTVHRVFPILDWATAGVGLGMAVLAGIGTPPADQTPSQREARDRRAEMVWTGGLLTAAVATASGIWGTYTINQCRNYVRWPPPPARAFSLLPPD